MQCAYCIYISNFTNFFNIFCTLTNIFIHVEKQKAENHFHDFPQYILASLTGVEPAAFRLGGERSILLSYRDNFILEQNSVHNINKHDYESQVKDALGISSKLSVP